MKKNSSNDVARAANVSQATVSRVFTSPELVSKKTREKVLQIAKELNYRPNALARSLITNKTTMIGLAMKEARNPFYYEILTLFSKAIREMGYTILFVYVEDESIKEEEIENLLAYNVAGIIITDALLTSSVANKLSDNNIPIVLFNRSDQDERYYSVSCDNYTASQEIASYISQQKCESIIYISGLRETSTNRDRELGFRRFFQQIDQPITILEGDYTYETAFTLVDSYLKNKNLVPDAIFGANDITALGALAALKKHNIQIPKETIVIGFDNIKMASWPDCLLSTWAQPISEMVSETLVSLFHPDPKNKTKKLSGYFIHRNTSR